MAVSSPEPSFLPFAPSHHQQQQSLQQQQHILQQNMQQLQQKKKPVVAKASSGSKLMLSNPPAVQSSFPPLNSPPFSAPQGKEGLVPTFNINNVTLNMGTEAQNGSRGAAVPAKSSMSSNSAQTTPSSSLHTSPSKPGSNGIKAFLHADLAFNANGAASNQQTQQAQQQQPTKRAHGSHSHKVKSMTSASSTASSSSNVSSSSGITSGRKPSDGGANGEQKVAVPQAYPGQAFVPYAGPAYVFSNAPFDMSRFAGFHPGVMPIYAPMKPNFSQRMIFLSFFLSFFLPFFPVCFFLCIQPNFNFLDIFLDIFFIFFSFFFFSFF